MIIGIDSTGRYTERPAPYDHVFRGDKSGGGIRPATEPPPSGEKEDRTPPSRATNRTPHPNTVPLPPHKANTSR